MVLSNGLVVRAVSVMREGDTICTTVYYDLPEGSEKETVYLDVLLQGTTLAAKLGVPFFVEGGEHGSIR